MAEHSKIKLKEAKIRTVNKSKFAELSSQKKSLKLAQKCDLAEKGQNSFKK